MIDALVEMEKAMKRDRIEVNDRQLACARISSTEGQNYLKAMASAANYAWVNRSSMTFLARQVHCFFIHLLKEAFIDHLLTLYNVSSNGYVGNIPAQRDGANPVIRALTVRTRSEVDSSALFSMQSFAKAFNSTPDDLDMHVIYDVSHNIAKFEEHISSH